MDDSEAKCGRCKTIKLKTEFYTNGFGGIRKPCKECLREANRRSYRKRPEGGIDRVYSYSLQRRYGITLTQYNEQLRKQAHRCAICRRPESAVTKHTGLRRRLAVDHDHASGQIRGLLCHLCNKLVWAIEENELMLDGITRYIARHRASLALGHAPGAVEPE